MHGSFNENAQQTWDFTRCQRPNGTFYGTRGKCRSGDEVGAKGYTSRQTKSILFVSRNRELRPIDTFSAIPLEREALLPRDTEQTIRSIGKDGEMLIIELD